MTTPSAFLRVLPPVGRPRIVHVCSTCSICAKPAVTAESRLVLVGIPGTSSFLGWNCCPDCRRRVNPELYCRPGPVGPFRVRRSDGRVETWTAHGVTHRDEYGRERILVTCTSALANNTAVTLFKCVPLPNE